MSGLTVRGDGTVIDPHRGIVPVCREIGDRRLKVVGTAFFLTRYGLFATAKHVLAELINHNTQTIDKGIVFQFVPPNTMMFRHITSGSFSVNADVALGQADNGAPDPARQGPMNLRGRISLVSPTQGETLSMFAYPDNEILQLGNPTSPPTLRGDYFHGTFLRHVESSSRPFIPHPHFETTIPIKSGASGAPVFNSRGQIVGIACRGWDFGGGDEAGELSSVVPMSFLLPLEVGCAQVPPKSWEYGETPVNRRDSTLTFGELIAYNHIDAGQRGDGAA